MKDRDCVPIISGLSTAGPLWRLGLGRLIQSFSSTAVHGTNKQSKKKVSLVGEGGNNLGGAERADAAVRKRRNVYCHLYFADIVAW